MGHSHVPDVSIFGDDSDGASFRNEQEDQGSRMNDMQVVLGRIFSVEGAIIRLQESEPDGDTDFGGMTHRLIS